MLLVTFAQNIDLPFRNNPIRNITTTPLENTQEQVTERIILPLVLHKSHTFPLIGTERKLQEFGKSVQKISGCKKGKIIVSSEL